MADPLILEIVSRGRGQPQYRRIDQLPYRVGRGYDNDLILADGTVSAAHLQFEQDASGAILIRNLSQENGTRLDQRKLGFDPEPLPLPSTLQVGHTLLRVLHPNTPVPPAIRPHAVPGSLALVERVPFALLLLTLLFAFESIQVFLNRIGPVTLREVLFTRLAEALAPILIALVTGFISRLLLHRWRFGLQLTIACVFAIAVSVTQELLYHVGYFFSSKVATDIGSVLLAGTVFTALFAWQLRAFSNLTQRRAIAVAIAIAWPVLVLAWVQQEVRAPDFRAQPELHLTLLAADRRAAETLELPQFLQQVRADLDTGIGRELAKPNKERAPLAPPP